jgi:hypothetical protein
VERRRRVHVLEAVRFDAGEHDNRNARPGSSRCSRRNSQPFITGMRKSSRITLALPPPRR